MKGTESKKKVSSIDNRRPKITYACNTGKIKHSHYSETAHTICQRGTEKWLEMQIESAEDLEREEISQ